MSKYVIIYNGIECEDEPEICLCSSDGTSGNIFTKQGVKDFMSKRKELPANMFKIVKLVKPVENNVNY